MNIHNILYYYIIIKTIPTVISIVKMVKKDLCDYFLI